MVRVAMTGRIDNDDEGLLQSLARGIAVIKAFRPGRERMTIAQVAAACSMTRAGARRILLTLQNLGYVGVDGRFFFLTARILDLGQGFLAQPIWEATRPELERISNVLNETASAGVLDGVDVVYTLRIRSKRVLQLDLQAGAHLPAYASSMGRVLLAALSDSELRTLLHRMTLTKLTPFTVVDKDELMREILKVREAGWAQVTDEVEEGQSGVSVPLVHNSGKTLAALNISISTRRATKSVVGETIVPMLRQAAKTVADSLGPL